MSGKITEDDRVSWRGLYNYAEAYGRAADALAENLSGVWAEAPVKMLYFHAVELYLKCFLRHQGVTVAELKASRLSHKLKNIADAAIARGLSISPESTDLMHDAQLLDEVIEARYLRNRLRPALSVEQIKQLKHDIQATVRAVIPF